MERENKKYFPTYHLEKYAKVEIYADLIAKCFYLADGEVNEQARKYLNGVALVFCEMLKDEIKERTE